MRYKVLGHCTLSLGRARLAVMGDREVNIILGVLLFIGVAYLCSAVVADGPSIHQALGNVAGGIVGALGAFYAVKVTIHEEAERDRKLRTESRRSEQNELLEIIRTECKLYAARLYAFADWLAGNKGKPLNYIQVRSRIPGPPVVLPSILSRIGLLPEKEVILLLNYFDHVQALSSRRDRMSGASQENYLATHDRVDIEAFTSHTCAAVAGVLPDLGYGDLEISVDEPDNLIKLYPELLRLQGMLKPPAA